MKAMCQLLILAFVFYFCRPTDSASIANAQGVSLQFVSFCDVLKDLTTRQRTICRDQMVLMASVADGAKLAMNECKKKFRNERWDCSGTEEPGSMLGRMTKAATKEAAFNYALVSAGVVHTMARDCMKGNLGSCHCSGAKRPQSLRKEYRWGGCGDNIKYAMTFAKDFLDDPRALQLNGKSVRTFAEKILMDNHNNEVGRQAILKNRLIVCKCHGATSHCTAKTCWYQLQKFGVIGDYLKEKYISAVEVRLSKRKGGKKVTLKSKNNEKLDLSDKLVHTVRSPMYCLKGLYTTGTTGRQCNITTTGPGSCNELCCGRGYRIKRQTVLEACRCKFQWCCDVLCDWCKRKVDVHICR